MWRISFFIILMSLVVYQFLPMQLLRYNRFSNHSMKQTLNLSARVLAVSLEKSSSNVAALTRDYRDKRNFIAEVDRDILLTEFNRLLMANIPGENELLQIKKNMLAKVLVYPDRFYIADRNDLWSPPYAFSFSHGNELVYINAQNDRVSYYDGVGNLKSDRTIGDYQVTSMEKNDLIIKKINGVIAQYTSEKVTRENGLRVKIRNPADRDPSYMADMGYFNVLDGVTFFVLYADNSSFGLWGRELRYRDYNVVGFTLE